MRKIDEYMRVGEAAKFLGVTREAIRYYEHTHKLPTYRDPASKYRLYIKEDLEKILKDIAESANI